MPAMLLPDDHGVDDRVVIDRHSLYTHLRRAFDGLDPELTKLIAERIIAERWAEISAAIKTEDVVSNFHAAASQFLLERLKR